MIDPFVRIPVGADRETADAIRARAAAEGREAVPEVPPTAAQRRLADWQATTPTCAADPETFLANIDAIASGRMRVTK